MLGFIQRKYSVSASQGAISVPEFGPRYGALLELHDVLGERPGLVGEEVLHLTQLLVQVRAVALGRQVLEW